MLAIKRQARTLIEVIMRFLCKHFELVKFLFSAFNSISLNSSRFKIVQSM